jgi:predicted DNA binding CopG/RHH family protein
MANPHVKRCDERLNLAIPKAVKKAIVDGSAAAGMSYTDWITMLVARETGREEILAGTGYGQEVLDFRIA